MDFDGIQGIMLLCAYTKSIINIYLCFLKILAISYAPIIYFPYTVQILLLA